MNYVQEEIYGKVVTISKYNSDEIIFTTNSGEVYKLHHNQDCCEDVFIQDDGNIENLSGGIISKITVDYLENDKEYCEHETITVYTFYTNKGIFKVIWNGSSNGYYSETPDFEKV